MRIEVDQSIIDDQMYDSAHERCGVLLGRKRHGVFIVKRLIELQNIHPDPCESFRIAGLDVHKAVRRSLFRGLGYWHTHQAWHPVGPSEHDVLAMDGYPRHIGLVLHPDSGSQTWFNHRGIIDINEE